MTDPLNPAELEKYCQFIGYSFSDQELLQRALTHKSFANEMGSCDAFSHNECLEFLGDAVLNLMVSVLLMKLFPEEQEGQLSKMRAALVNKKELAQVAKQLKLGELLRLGKGEERSEGRSKPSLLADAFEALLGALFMDGGLEPPMQLLQKTMGERIATVKNEPGTFDPKSHLQELMQQNGYPPPQYNVVESTGPDHLRHYVVTVDCGQGESGRGSGPNKKIAEQAAAEEALSKFKGASLASLSEESEEG